jgi:hypothetical protein
LALLVKVINGGVDGALEMVDIAKGSMGEEMPLQVAARHVR